MPKWFEIKALAGDPDTTSVLIYGDIGANWWDDESIDAKSFTETLAAINSANLVIRVNSIGGSVADGLAIYNAIKRHPAKSIAYVDAVAYSIASLIPMAADEVVMAENALMMLHAPWTYTAGNAKELRLAADVLDTYAKAMASSYVTKSGKSEAEILTLLTDGVDHYYTAAEAVAEGFADRVGDSMPVAAALAQQFDLTRFRRTAPAGQSNPPKEIPPMPQASKTAGAPNPETPPADQSAIEAKAREEALAADKTRRETIRAAFKPFLAREGIQALLDACMDDHKIDATAAGQKLLAKLGEEAESANPQGYSPSVQGGMTDREKRVVAFTNALMAKTGQARADGANPYRGHSLFDIARDCAVAAGADIAGLDRTGIAKAALTLIPRAAGMTTSDFPILLENVMHKLLLTAYQTTPDTWSLVCAQSSVSDFRDWKRYRAGVFGNIDDVNEAGEYKTGTIGDAQAEKIAVTRRGKILRVTPELIVNDDLGGLANIAAQMGRGAKRTIEAKFYALLVSNPALSDGKALFHVDHGNLAGAGAAVSVDTLEAGRVGMAKQMDTGGQDYLDIRPSIWLGPIGIGGDVRVIVDAQYDPDTANKLQRPNKARGIVDNIVDTPRLSGNAWYLFASPQVAPTIEVVFLEGQTEPMVTTEQDFDTSGVKYKIELPFGIAPVDYRGAWKNPGP